MIPDTGVSIKTEQGFQSVMYGLTNPTKTLGDNQCQQPGGDELLGADAAELVLLLYLCEFFVYANGPIL